MMFFLCKDKWAWLVPGEPSVLPRLVSCSRFGLHKQLARLSSTALRSCLHHTGAVLEKCESRRGHAVHKDDGCVDERGGGGGTNKRELRRLVDEGRCSRGKGRNTSCSEGRRRKTTTWIGTVGEQGYGATNEEERHWNTKETSSTSWQASGQGTCGASSG